MCNNPEFCGAAHRAEFGNRRASRGVNAAKLGGILHFPRWRREASDDEPPTAGAPRGLSISSYRRTECMLIASRIVLERVAQFH